MQHELMCLLSQLLDNEQHQKKRPSYSSQTHKKILLLVDGSHSSIRLVPLVGLLHRVL